MIDLQKKARGARPRYFPDPAVERLTSILLALVGETAVIRDRLDSVERLLASGGPVTPEVVDAYKPDATARADRDAWRGRYLDMVFRAIHQDREELETLAGQSSYDDVITHVTTG